MLIMSDEIHQDFARPGFAHCSLGTLGQETLEDAIICTSASKTFNLAGLQASNIVIPDADIRARFEHAAAAGYSQPNTLGLVATETAYEHGGEWLSQLKDYLEGNWALLEERLRPYEGRIHLVESESTYLAWIDCRGLGLFGDELKRFVEDEAGLCSTSATCSARMVTGSSASTSPRNAPTSKKRSISSSTPSKRASRISSTGTVAVPRICRKTHGNGGSATHLPQDARERWQCHGSRAGCVVQNTP